MADSPPRGATRAYLIDASPYVFRAYFALPDSIRDPSGRPVHAVYGFADFLFGLLRRPDLTHVAVAFDESLTTSFRNDLWPDYKAHRDLPPAELEAQLADCRELARAAAVACFASERYAADDLIATLKTRIGGDVDGVVVVSSDKDLAQLVDERTVLFDAARDRWLDEAAVRERFGVSAGRVVELLALAGDAVDNIPGVRGIGPKTAVALLGEFETVEELLADPARIESIGIRGASGVRRKIERDGESAVLSRRLVELVEDVDVGRVTAEDLRWTGPDRERVDALCDRLGFGAIRDRLPASPRRSESA